MKLSELVSRLVALQELHGDVEVSFLNKQPSGLTVQDIVSTSKNFQKKVDEVVVVLK